MSKRIAYLVQHDITKNDGVAKKIASQVDEWRKLGFGVQVYAIVPKVGPSVLEARQYVSRGYIRLRLLPNKNLLSDIESYSPDIVYFRYNSLSRDFLWLSRRFKIVGELNTLDIEEFKLLAVTHKTIKAWLRYFSYRFLRKFVLNRLSGLVGVTYEILEHESNKNFGQQKIVVPNAIDLDAYPTIKSLSSKVDKPNLFFIGTPNQPWHGVDLIRKMAVDLPDFNFHIVGLDGTNLHNLFYYGYLPKSEYLKILRKCHICIGSIAMYRNGMKEACPLKVREYLSYGFPVIAGYQDTAFLDVETPSWFLKVDRNIDYDLVVDFVDRNRNVVVRHEELTAISTVKNERKRTEFFREICDSEEYSCAEQV